MTKPPLTPSAQVDLKSSVKRESVCRLANDRQVLAHFRHAAASLERTPAPGRNLALDFTKGTLVLIMVLYHWMNYFLVADGSVYKYLRFLTPSFIFITGFLIAQLYLISGKVQTAYVPTRLLVRAAKLMLIVSIFNIAINAMRIISHTTVKPSTTILLGCLVGTVPIAFSVLLPIAYLLFLSAGLLLASRWYTGIFHLLSAVFVVCAFWLEMRGSTSGYLQLLSIGILGTSVGHMSIARLNRLINHPLELLVLYGGYVSAVARWGDGYVLQIVGVCISLAVIYWIGCAQPRLNQIQQTLILLGRYSLFGYIIQILILQLLRKGLHPLGTRMNVLVVALSAGMALTILIVRILDYTRIRSGAVNRLYTAVFC
jgi:hypothetical protein